MIKLLIVFVHLLAVCTAIGAIIATDLRLVGKLVARRPHIGPPNEYVMRLIAGSLAVLYASGAALIWIGHQESAVYLDNPKLQAKLVLVALLTLNAVLLHWHTFPWLGQAPRVSSWRFAEGLRVAVPVAASNSLWLFCAFLGIARPWNFVVPMQSVLLIAAVLFLLTLAGVLGALAFAARASAARSVQRRSRARASASDAEPMPAGLGTALRGS